jgi:hypothetical protein
VQRNRNGRTRLFARALLVVIAATAGLTIIGPARAAHAAIGCTSCPVIANDDEYTTTFSSTFASFSVPKEQGVLANDTGRTGTAVAVLASDTESWFGSAKITLSTSGAFTYKPNPNLAPFSGIDSFDYTIRRGTGDNSEEDYATAYINVRPVVTNDTYYFSALSSATLNVNAPGVLANDRGLDDSTYDADAVTAQGGSVSTGADGSFLYTPATGFAGTDTFEYNAWDLNGDDIWTGTVTVNVFNDNIVPLATISSPTNRIARDGRVNVSWSGSDPGGLAASGIASYTVERKTKAWNGSFTPWATWKSNTTSKSTSFSGAEGVSYCFRVRSRDKVGNFSAYTPTMCTSVPVMASHLAYTGPWATTSRSDVYGGVVKTTTQRLAKATRSAVTAERLYLIATKCASCGTVQVRWNNVVVATVNLAASSTLRNQVIALKSWASLQTGTLTLLVTSPTGRSVTVEGLGVYAD